MILKLISKMYLCVRKMLSKP